MRSMHSWISTTYFVAVGCLLLLGAFISLERHHIVERRLFAPPSNTIGATDVLSAARRGNGDLGVALLISLGPVAGIFRGPIALASVGVLLLLTAGLHSRRLRSGAVVGMAWASAVVVLLVIALARISVSYSLAAKILMFGPALALNIGLLVALGRRLVFSSSVR